MNPLQPPLSFILDKPIYGAGMISLLNEKLRLEDERVRRTLPDLPTGYSWHGEVQALEHVDFASGTGSTTIRIVYRLHGPDNERLTSANG